jgi:hypothetical protein
MCSVSVGPVDPARVNNWRGRWRIRDAGLGTSESGAVEKGSAIEKDRDGCVRKGGGTNRASPDTSDRRRCDRSKGVH